jgi:hypothetical protein
VLREILGHVPMPGLIPLELEDPEDLPELEDGSDSEDAAALEELEVVEAVEAVAALEAVAAASAADARELEARALRTAEAIQMRTALGVVATTLEAEVHEAVEVAAEAVAACTASGMISVAEFRRRVGQVELLAARLEMALRMISLCAKDAARMAKVAEASATVYMVWMAARAVDAVSRLEGETPPDEVGPGATLLNYAASLDVRSRRHLQERAAAGTTQPYEECLRRLRERGSGGAAYVPPPTRDGDRGDRGSLQEEETNEFFAKERARTSPEETSRPKALLAIAQRHRVPETKARELCKDTAGSLANFSRATLRGALGGAAATAPSDAIATLMKLLQSVGDVCVRWSVVRASDEALGGDRFRVALAVVWWRSTNERSVGPGFHINAARELLKSLPRDLLWDPALHPNGRRYTQAQDRVYRRGYPGTFPSIKKAKQDTAQRLLDELGEGNHFRDLWNDTWLTCMKCGHHVVQRRHLHYDPKTGHISILSRLATVARSEYAQLFCDDGIYLTIPAEENPLIRLTSDSSDIEYSTSSRTGNGEGRCMHCGRPVCELTIRGVEIKFGRRDQHPLYGTVPPGLFPDPIPACYTAIGSRPHDAPDDMTSWQELRDLKSYLSSPRLNLLMDITRRDLPSR